MQRFLIVLITVCTLLAAGLLVWWRFGLPAANEIVDEANVEIEAFNVALLEAQGNFDLLFNDTNKQQFPKNRGRWERVARDTGALYEKSAGHARAVSEKFAEAARQTRDAEVADYNRALSDRFAKRAERCEILKEYTLLWVDPTLQSVDALTTKQTEINYRLVPILAEEKASDDKANEIAKAQAGKFEADRPN